MAGHRRAPIRYAVVGLGHIAQAAVLPAFAHAMRNSSFSMTVRRGDIRTRKAFGGGTLYDIGVYCINAARYLFRAEPKEVMAISVNQGSATLAEVDESTAAILRFEGERVASLVARHLDGARGHRHCLSRALAGVALAPAHGAPRSILLAPRIARHADQSSRNSGPP